MATSLNPKTKNVLTPPRLGIKVDVDTLEGYRQGVPALLEILAERGIKASFFLALGPDNSGRAVLRVFRQQGFLQKMLRTRAPAIYGFKTMCYGTLLPAPLIYAAAPELPGRIAAVGHEVGLHGYDHVRWHDRLLNMNEKGVFQEIGRAQEIFSTLLGRPARSFASPGWQCSRESQSVLAAHGFDYSSNTRGFAPYFPCFGKAASKLLEIPTTLPTLDELLGLDGCRPRDFNSLVLSRLNPERPQVLTIHAEMEGGPFRRDFARLLDRCLEDGVKFFRLADYARELRRHPEQVPVAPVYQGRLPGRGGTVSRQGLEEAHRCG